MMLRSQEIRHLIRQAGYRDVVCQVPGMFAKCVATENDDEKERYDDRRSIIEPPRRERGH